MTHMMTNNQTDWKELCVQLYATLEAHSTTWDDEVLLDRVGTALRRDHPEPEGPTDEELETTAKAAEIQYSKEHGGFDATTPDGIYAQLQAQRLAGLRAVAARWGRPSIEPVPASERDEAFDQLRAAQQYAGEMLAGICDQQR